VAYKQEYARIEHKLETRALLRSKSIKNSQILFAICAFNSVVYLLHSKSGIEVLG